MSDVALKDLLQAGVHFGHQTHRWNPKMKRYIFAERGGIYIIDLKKTLLQIGLAQDLVRETVLAGDSVLFVCTKPQLKETVKAEAERAGAFYVTERWMGGMLTNFQTIKKNIERLKELERGVDEGAFDFYTKKEQLLLERERQKLDRYLSGIKDMSKLPGLVFVVDAKKEEIAVREANRLGIPVVAIADTNADPDTITIPIAGNDDAIRSVALITRVIADSLERAAREAPQLAAVAKDEDEVYTYSSDMTQREDKAARSKRRKPRPRRRPKPEVIAARLHHTDGQDEGKGSKQEAADAPEGDKADPAADEAPVTPEGETVAGAEKGETVAGAAEGETAETGVSEADGGPTDAEGDDDASSGEEAVAVSPDASGGEEERGAS
jgi:small subunit ribosomal protein S2